MVRESLNASRQEVLVSTSSGESMTPSIFSDSKFGEALVGLASNYQGGLVLALHRITDVVLAQYGYA